MQRSQQKISRQIHLGVNKSIHTNKDGLSSLQELSNKKLVTVGCNNYSLNRKVRILNLCEGEHEGASETLSAWCSWQEDLQLQGVPEEEVELQESTLADAQEVFPLSRGWLLSPAAGLGGPPRFNGEHAQFAFSLFLWGS